MGKWMSDQSKTLPLKTSGDLFHTISSAESAVGRMPLDLPDGRTSDPSNPPAYPASPGVSRDAEQEPQTNDISGPSSGNSSNSTALQSFLESNLPVILDGLGSPLYGLKWKNWDMDAGRPICALRASVPRTSGKGSTGSPASRKKTGDEPQMSLFDAGKSDRQDVYPQEQAAGWPTPVANDDNKTPEAHLRMKKRMGGNRTAITSLQVMAKTVIQEEPTTRGWATPSARDYKSEHRKPDGMKRRLERPGGMPLSVQAILVTGWPTPNAIPKSRGGLQTNPKKALERREQGHQLNLDDAATLAGWPTPNVPNGGRSISTAERRGNSYYHKGRKVQVDIGAVARMVMAGWTTPMAMEPLTMKARPSRNGADNRVFGTTGRRDSDGAEEWWSDWNPWQFNVPVWCSDGKYRPAPVPESGIRPLATRVPARLGRLRAYGNAIVPPLAAHFIRTYRLYEAQEKGDMK